jgi:hypothetical protein
MKATFNTAMAIFARRKSGISCLDGLIFCTRCLGRLWAASLMRRVASCRFTFTVAALTPDQRHATDRLIYRIVAAASDEAASFATSARAYPRWTRSAPPPLCEHAPWP